MKLVKNMQEKDIYNTKKELANFYFFLKNWTSKEVITIYVVLINYYRILLIRK